MSYQAGERENVRHITAEASDSSGDLYQKERFLGSSLWALKVLMRESGLCESYVMPPLYPGSLDEQNILRKGWQAISNTGRDEL